MNIPEKWGKQVMTTSDLKTLGLMCKDDTIIDCLHDLTARVEKMEGKTLVINKPTLLEPLSEEPASQPEQQEINLVGEFDARKWAKEFMRMWGKSLPKEIDEGLMIGWFANAIMSGYDNANWKRDKERQDHIVDTNKKVEPGKEEWRELWEKVKTTTDELNTTVTADMKTLRVVKKLVEKYQLHHRPHGLRCYLCLSGRRAFDTELKEKVSL